MFHLLIIVITTSMLTTTMYGASQRQTISTVQVGQLEAEYRKATNQIDKARILNTLRESGFAHIVHYLTQNNDELVIEPRIPTVIAETVVQPVKKHVKKPAMPVAHTGYEIKEGAAPLQALSNEPEVIEKPSLQHLQQEKELAYQRQREIEQQRHKEEQQKEAALQAAKKPENEKREFEQLLASLAKDVNKEGRSLQQMNITMQWIDKYMGQLTRSDVAQEDKDRILAGFKGIKDLLAQKIIAFNEKPHLIEYK